MNLLLFAFLTFLLSESNGGKLAPFIKPCKSSDKKCILTSAQAAIPYFTSGISEINVHPSDPLHFKEINADQGDLKMTFRNTDIVGLSKCKIQDISRDAEKISFEMDCPFSYTGTYKLDGKLLFIPAQGEGDFEIKTDKAKIFVNFKYKTITEKSGDKHWKITNFDYSYDLIEKVFIKLDNLFGGDETRAKPILEMFDHSWKELITEMGAPIFKEMANQIADGIKRFLLAVPTTELELI